MSAAQKLLEVKPSTSVRQIAVMIAEMFMEATDAPYRFSINHDVRPPKCLACPFEYDWVLKDHVGIDTKNASFAKGWLMNAAMQGYVICRVDARHAGVGDWSSINIVRRRAYYHQLPKLETDDDIPF